MSKKLEKLEENLLEERKISSYIAELTLKYGSFEDIMKPVLKEKEEMKLLQEKCKRDLLNDVECLTQEYTIDVFKRNTYPESLYYEETKNLFKKVLDETLTGKNPKLDNYYQREINRYYIQFLDIILNYHNGYCISKSNIDIGILGNNGIAFKIEDQVFYLIENFGVEKLGTYSESEKIIYLFFLSPSDKIRYNLTNKERNFCLSLVAKSAFFHEMTHKLDSEALRGNDKDARLSITKREKRDFETKGIRPNKIPEQKRNSNGEFNATLFIFIRYFEDSIKAEEVNGNEIENRDKYVSDMMNSMLNRFKYDAENVTKEGSVLSLLKEMYDGLNTSNRNRLANSLHDYFSQKFFESMVHYETFEESYTRLKKLLAEQ